MTLEIKHTFVCGIATDPAATLAGKVTPDKWNEALTITQATGKILGRKTASAGATEELAFTDVLDLVGSPAQGDILYRNATVWTRLAAGTASQTLLTGGAAANPFWGRAYKLDATVAPGVDDDVTGGYAPGSIWLDQVTGKTYVCFDATDGAAIWYTAPDTVPVGAISDFAGTSAPTGWLLCYGQAISRTTYDDLFAVIATTFGVGDGSTTFNLPDLRGRVSAGQDDMGGTSANRLTGTSGGVDGDTFGATGGAETHTLTEAEMPSHDHNAPTGTNFSSYVGGAGLGVGSRQFTGERGVATDSTGGSSAHNNVQPTIILNKIIKF